MNYTKTLPVTGPGMIFGLTSGQLVGVILAIGLFTAIVAAVIHSKFRKDKTIGE